MGESEEERYARLSEEYIPKEIAEQYLPLIESRELRKLGFDGASPLYWSVGGHSVMIDENYDLYYSITIEGSFVWEKNSRFHPETYVPPTWSQAFEWFRKTFKLHAEPTRPVIREGKVEAFDYRIVDANKTGLDIYNLPASAFETPEQARLACLKRLIEIVKEDL